VEHFYKTITPLFLNPKLPFEDLPLFKFFVPTLKEYSNINDYRPNHFAFPLPENLDEIKCYMRPPLFHSLDDGLREIPEISGYMNETERFFNFFQDEYPYLNLKGNFMSKL